MYFVTGLTNIITDQDVLSSEKVKKHSSRCFGYFANKEEAVSAVKMNACDMWETIYDYIVVEYVGEGIHSIGEVVGWFKYDVKNNKYSPITIGKTGFINYAIG